MAIIAGVPKARKAKNRKYGQNSANNSGEKANREGLPAVREIITTGLPVVYASVLRACHQLSLWGHQNILTGMRCSTAVEMAIRRSFSDFLNRQLSFLSFVPWLSASPGYLFWA